LVGSHTEGRKQCSLLPFYWNGAHHCPEHAIMALALAVGKCKEFVVVCRQAIHSKESRLLVICILQPLSAAVASNRCACNMDSMYG
jgi:hypothetical protein